MFIIIIIIIYHVNPWPGRCVRPQLPALEGKIREPEGGEAEDAEVHRLEGERLLALVEGDPVEARRGPVSLVQGEYFVEKTYEICNVDIDTKKAFWAEITEWILDFGLGID